MKKPPVINDGDYLIDEKKLSSFIQKIRAMADQEFGIDVDGDSLVQIIGLDRTRYEANQYFTIAYEHKAKTEKERNAIFKDLLSNLETASRFVSTALRQNEYRRLSKEKNTHWDSDGNFCERTDCSHKRFTSNPLQEKL